MADLHRRDLTAGDCMCGIAGRCFLDDGSPLSAEDLTAMSATLQHRGPDGQGEWTGEGIQLVHRRLSIIDPSGSAQPLVDADENLALVFNGEILNYRDLRGRFSGYCFRTKGDAETILAAYAAEGLAGFRRLEGQFAFALYDRRSRTLWLVRDPVGILPLYYYSNENSITFASEIKALLPSRANQTVDPLSLDEYLAARAIRSDRTLFEGIKKVPPGHALEFSRRGRSFHQLTCYRKFSKGFDPRQPVTASSVIDQVESAICRAVTANLVADVPVGAYLSGGVDSALVVAVARRQVPEMHTFTATFNDRRMDEAGEAAATASYLRSTHHEVPVSATDFERLWSALTYHRDAPLSEPADIALFRLAEQARDHVKVLLSGEGADELFGGYPKYRFAAVSAHAARVPVRLRSGILHRLDLSLPWNARRLRVAMRALSEPTEAGIHEGWFAPFTTLERRELGATPRARDRAHIEASNSPLRRMMLYDLEGWLPGNLLERGDRMSMAASVELRPALLHPAVVESALAVPDKFLVRKGEGKWILRQVARRHLPRETAERAKRGFRVPLDAWFREGLSEFVHDTLLSPTAFVQQVFDRAQIERLIQRHMGGRDEDIRIWTLVALEVWHATFFRR